MLSCKTYLLLCIWLSAVIWGVHRTYRYSFTPVPAANAPESWPSVEGLPLTPGVWTLVMFVHPNCPCTRASICELSRLTTRCAGRMTAIVVFVTFDDLSTGVLETDLWREANALSGVRLAIDDDRELQSQFKPTCSGETFLYDLHGRLMFQGGITPSRGHSGDSVGQDAIMALVTSGTGGPITSPVFGCALQDRPVRNCERRQ
jgi:hypothetical protein